MKNLNETTFAKTLIELAESLEQRHQDGMTQTFPTDAPEILRSAGICINDQNIQDVYSDLIRVLQHWVVTGRGQAIDSEESLTTIGQHLIQLQVALPESGFTPIMQDHLSSALTERIQQLEQMLDALQRYLSQ